MIFSKLATIMEQKGIKPYPLSKKLGVSRTFIYSLMNGDFELVSAKNLNTLCHHLGLKSLEELLVFEPIEIYIYKLNGDYTEFYSVAHDAKKNDFNFSQYVVYKPDKEHPAIKLRIEINNDKYDIEVFCHIIEKDDISYNDENVGIKFEFSELSFTEDLPMQSSIYIGTWLHMFFKHYMNKVEGKNPSYSSSPLQSFDTYETENKDILEIVNEIADKQELYYHSLLSHLEQKE